MPAFRAAAFAVLSLLAACASQYTIVKPTENVPEAEDTFPAPADTPEAPPEDTPPADTPEDVVDEPPPDDTPTSPPGEPIAMAGIDQNVDPLDLVRLDGSASFDPAGLAITAYDWTIIRRPAGSSALLIRPATQRPTFVADLAGDYEIKLTVKNSGGVWDSTPDKVIVHAAPTAHRFYVQLTWNTTNTDLDLHVKLPAYGIFEGPGDCAFCRRAPLWPGYTRAESPSLDRDDIDGYGPETATIDMPGNVTFDVQVHYYGENGLTSCSNPNCPNVLATLDFYIDGLIVDTMQTTLTNQGEVWQAATVSFPAAAVTPVNVFSSTSRSQCY